MSTFKIYSSFIIVLLLLGVASLKAQNSYISQLSFDNTKIDHQDNTISLNMDVVLTDLDLGANESLLIIPVLKSNTDEKLSKEYRPLIINGKRKNKVVNRQIALKTPSNYNTLNPVEIVLIEKNKPQVVAYDANVAYEEWMKDASLSVKTESRGCADCDLGSESDLLLASIFPTEYEPQFTLSYIKPEPEPIKTRSDTHSATFNFIQGKYNLLRDYKDNAPKFAETDRIIREVQNNKDLDITEFSMMGYASPEGNFESNRILAANRANSFAHYLETKLGVNRGQLQKIEGKGEDWEGLLKAVEASNIADKQAIIRIINEVNPPDARDAELMKLSGGNTYRVLLGTIYPPLRRTEYTIAYHVRAFSVEEAKGIIKTNPKLLSLNEMFLVAYEYPTDSKEFKEIFEIGSHVFPTDPIFIINNANVEIERGNYTAAIERLKPLMNDPRAYNIIGIALAKTGETEKAKEYLSKAAAQGDTNAQNNLAELQKYIDSKNQ